MVYFRSTYIPIFLLIFGLITGISAQAHSIRPVRIDNQSHIITVTTTSDEDNGYMGGGLGISLREAVAYAPEGAVVILPIGRFVIGRNNASLIASRDLILKGSGIGKTIIDGNENGSVLSISLSADLSISGLTITGGNALRGGAIFNAGTLAMYAVALNGNRAIDGGALYNEGALDMASCIVRDNNAEFYGGGIHNDGGNIRLTDVGLLRNTGSKGGGMYNQFGFVVMRDGTIFGNVAGTGGGVTDYIGLTEISNTSAAGNFGGNYEGRVLTLGENFDSDGTSRFSNGVAGDTVRPETTLEGIALSNRRAVRTLN